MKRVMRVFILVVIIGLIGLSFIVSGTWGAEITFTTLTFVSEGAPVQAILYQPREVTGKLPALVFSTGLARNLKAYEWLYRPLAEHGYVLLAQRYRDGDVRFHLRDVEDIRHAISHLQGLPYVDPQRIGIIGHSRGGNASLRAAAKDPRVRSTIALSPPTDYARLVRGLREHAPTRYRGLLKVFGGTPEEAPDYYQAISTMNYADQIKTPVLLVHGTGDFIASHDHSQWMYDALMKAGNPHVKLELLPGLGHFYEQGFGGYRFEKVAELVSRWFSETLK